jgi:hypothetical protein
MLSRRAFLSSTYCIWPVKSVPSTSVVFVLSDDEGIATGGEDIPSPLSTSTPSRALALRCSCRIVEEGGRQRFERMVFVSYMAVLLDFFAKVGGVFEMVSICLRR